MLGSWTPRLLEQLLPFWRPRDDSIRLTFQYDQSGIRLVGRVRRGKPAPPGDVGGQPVSPDQIFLEVRSRQSRTLYRCVLHEPIRQSAEVFEPDGRIRTVPARGASGVFSVVIPADRLADHLVILAGPAVELGKPGFVLERDASGRARQIFRMRLTGD